MKDYSYAMDVLLPELKKMKDESHLPVAEQSLIFRLRKRAEIRRNNTDRKSVQEGRPDRISDLLEEAANRLEQLEQLVNNQQGEKHG